MLTTIFLSFRLTLNHVLSNVIDVGHIKMIGIHELGVSLTLTLILFSKKDGAKT